MSRVEALVCVRCQTRFPVAANRFECLNCKQEAPSNLTVLYDDMAFDGITREGLAEGPDSLWRYAHSLPVSAEKAVTMGEGRTPLVPLSSLAEKIGVANLSGKAEYANPTGSFKDRLASVAISTARELFDAKVIATSSSGNAGAAAAAYASRAGLPCVVFSFGSSTDAMVAQMRAYGAMVVMVHDKAHRWQLLAEGVERLGWFPTSPFFAPVVGSNPFGIEGYKSIAYELLEQHQGDLPDWIILPICYGDALVGLSLGFEELKRLGWTERTPRLVAAEIYGSLEAAIETGSDAIPDQRRNRDTVAISIGATQSTYQALAAVRHSGGCAVTAEEDEILHWHREIATSEGIFIEPSSAASLAALARLRREGTIGAADRVTCLLTASGLKDTATASRGVEPPPIVPADLDKALDAITEHYGCNLK